MIICKKNFREYISYYNMNTLESRTDKLMGGNISRKKHKLKNNKRWRKQNK